MPETGRERSVVRGDRGVDPGPARRAKSKPLGEWEEAGSRPRFHVLGPTATSPLLANFRSIRGRRCAPGTGLLGEGWESRDFTAIAGLSTRRQRLGAGELHSIRVQCCARSQSAGGIARQLLGNGSG
jgi:hypothetical protein